MALKTTSKIMRGKQMKVKALIARLTLMLCAKQNPSMYSRYDQTRKKFLTMKMAIIKKYTPQAVMAARKLLNARPREASK